jgi:hypothetical protein
MIEVLVDMAAAGEAQVEVAVHRVEVGVNFMVEDVAGSITEEEVVRQLGVVGELVVLSFLLRALLRPSQLAFLMLVMPIYSNLSNHFQSLLSDLFDLATGHWASPLLFEPIFLQ